MTFSKDRWRLFGRRCNAVVEAHPRFFDGRDIGNESREAADNGAGKDDGSDQSAPPSPTFFDR